ncbi:AraC family transcriptional regulator [Vibrio cholerae]|uniref:AraC family transcriptional regulator n=1 Tax=Vibrio cholerae TaxID=666 RepID=UPI0034E0BAA2
MPLNVSRSYLQSDSNVKKISTYITKKVADICGKVGYSDVRYFTKSFTKYAGLKPKEYRKLYS